MRPQNIPQLKTSGNHKTPEALAPHTKNELMKIDDGILIIRNIFPFKITADSF
ncbi:MAG: hypothetical protein M3Q70_02925 [bacterium]|nr:hypothetical protein [bacterium]